MGMKLIHSRILFFMLLPVHLTYANPIVFTTQTIRLAHVPADVEICELVKNGSRPKQLKEQLNFASRAELNAWLTVNQKQLTEFQTLTACQYKAAFYGIQKLPAVIDKHFVVYGEDNVAKALQEIKNFQRTKGVLS